MSMFNPFLPTVPTFAVRETDVSRHNGGTSGPPIMPSALRALSSLRGLRGAPEVPPLCRETSVSWIANVETVGKNGLMPWRSSHLQRLQLPAGAGGERGPAGAPWLQDRKGGVWTFWGKHVVLDTLKACVRRREHLCRSTSYLTR